MIPVALTFLKSTFWKSTLLEVDVAGNYTSLLGSRTAVAWLMRARAFRLHQRWNSIDFLCLLKLFTESM